MNDNANIHALATSNKSRDDKAVMFASGRLSDARKWFAHRGWDVLPQSDRGQSILRWGADHAWLAGRTNPKRSVRNWCRRWAPWLSHIELRRIIAETEDSNKRWSHDQSAAVLEITVRDREALRFRFLGANDDPNYDRRLQIRKEKGAARARKFRATHSTGAKRGRPSLGLTPEKKLARTNAQTAERMRRLRLRKNASREIKNIGGVTDLSVTQSSPILFPALIVDRRAPKARRRLAPDDPMEPTHAPCSLALRSALNHPSNPQWR